MSVVTTWNIFAEKKAFQIKLGLFRPLLFMVVRFEIIYESNIDRADTGTRTETKMAKMKFSEKSKNSFLWLLIISDHEAVDYKVSK